MLYYTHTYLALRASIQHNAFRERADMRCDDVRPRGQEEDEGHTHTTRGDDDTRSRKKRGTVPGIHTLGLVRARSSAKRQGGTGGMCPPLSPALPRDAAFTHASTTTRDARMIHLLSISKKKHAQFPWRERERERSNDPLSSDSVLSLRACVCICRLSKGCLLLAPFPPYTLARVRLREIGARLIKNFHPNGQEKRAREEPPVFEKDQQPGRKCSQAGKLLIMQQVRDDNFPARSQHKNPSLMRTCTPDVGSFFRSLICGFTDISSFSPSSSSFLLSLDVAACY